MFEVPAIRERLAASPEAVLTVRRETNAAEREAVRTVQALDRPFTFEFNGHLDRLEAALNRAFRGTNGTVQSEGLISEIGFLMRLFASVSGDASPRVVLAPFSTTAAAPPGSTDTQLTLVTSFRGSSQRASGEVLWRRGSGDFEPPEDTRDGDLLLILTSTSAPLVTQWDPAARGLDEIVGVEAADVVLLSMPFADLRHPSIALGMLKQLLNGHSVAIRYLTFEYARRIGAPFYQWIAGGKPAQPALVGEWLFSRGLFGSEESNGHGYVDDVLQGSPQVPRISASFARHLRHLRSEIDPYLEHCVEQVLAYQPRLVGFTSVFQQQLASLALARRLKERAPEIFILFGGANCEGEMGVEVIRRFPFVDAVVSGEGEVVFPPLVDAVLGGRSIDELKGVYTRANLERVIAAGMGNAPSAPDMDALPIPDHDDLFSQSEESGLGDGAAPRMLFETSRGCWWGEIQHCTFCGLNGGQMRFRSKSADRALAELEHLTTRYPGHRVGVVDNILDMKYLETLIPELASRDLGVELFYEVKANLRKDQLRIMRDAGILEIQPGIESLSTAVLKLMRKGVRGIQNIQLLKWCRELGVHPYWNFIWGFPDEPEEDYETMAELLPSLFHLQPPVRAGSVFLHRFSPNYFEAEQLGLANVRPTRAYRDIYPGDTDYPGDADSAARLAYYFDFDYARPRDVGTYTAPLAQRILDWQDAFDGSQLIYLNKESHLLVWDFRPDAEHSVQMFEGVDREVLLACDSIRSIAHLRRVAAQEAGRELESTELDDRIERLANQRLVVREGNAVLSLVLPMPSQTEDGVAA